MKNTFTCPTCEETFAYARSDKEALDEYDLLHGNQPMAADPVCDDCYAYLAFFYGWPVIREWKEV